MRSHIVADTNNCAETSTFCGASHVSATVQQPSDVVRGVLRHEFGRFRNGIKLLAQAAGGVSPRTAEAWINGRASPSLQNIVPLMANCDALADAINKMVEERKCQER